MKQIPRHMLLLRKVRININMSPEEKAIKDIEKLILDSDYIEITDEIKGSLKLAVKKLKEVGENE